MDRQQASDFLRNYLDFIKGEEWANEPDFNNLYSSFEVAISELGFSCENCLHFSVHSSGFSFCGKLEIGVKSDDFCSKHESRPF